MRFKVLAVLFFLAAGAMGQVAPAPSSCCTPPPSNLAAWWRFDPAGAPSRDSTAFDNVAVHNGGPTPASGVVGQALCFNGSAANAVVANHGDVDFAGACPNSQPFVIDFYVKTSQASGVTTILDKRDSPQSPRGWSVYLHNGRPGLQIATGNGSATCGPTAACTNETSPVSIADGAWHYVAIRVGPRCGASARGDFFVDGYRVHTFTPRQGDMSNSGPLYIGRVSPAFGTSFFNGCLDEVEITKRAMSDAEIFAIYNAGAKGKCVPSQPCVLDPGMTAAHNTFARRPAALAQTFTPAQSGKLTQITHGLQSLAGSITDYDLLITTTLGGLPKWNGGAFGSPDVLYAGTSLTTFANSGIVNGTVSIPALLQPYLNAGTQYALVIIPRNPATGTMNWRGNSGAGTYPTGSAYELNGTVWSVPAIGPKDHGFRLNGTCP
jgi:hypothetical protein